MEFVYWNLRGRSLPLRMLLAYNNDHFTLHEYDLDTHFSAEAHKDSENWFDQRQSLDADFPNLPHLKTQDAGTICETLAIARYLARRHRQTGTNAEEMARTDTFVHAYYDMWEELIDLVFPTERRETRTKRCGSAAKPPFERLRDVYVTQTLKRRLEHIGQRLGERKFWLGGSEPTLSDFLLYDVVDIWLRLAPEAEFGENLKAFYRRVRSLDKLKRFFDESPEYFIKPIFPPFCRWTGA